MVQVTLTGKGEMRKIKIDKTLVDPNEIEVLEDLILAAFNDAKQRVESHVAD
jgi:nucleoid-associated protein EbfC